MLPREKMGEAGKEKDVTVTEQDKTYNGWKNYETWSVALIVDNERGLYEQRREMARQAWDEAEPDRSEYHTRSQGARYAFADALKDWVEEQVEVKNEGYGQGDRDAWGMLCAQLIGAALSEVDWTEIADNWLNEEVNENGAGGYEVDA